MTDTGPAPDNINLENRKACEYFFSYWAQALDGPWFGAKVLVMDRSGDAWRELVVVGNEPADEYNVRTDYRHRTTSLLEDLAAVLKRHGATFEKRTSSDYEGGYFENWSIEGEGIEIDLEDAMDLINAEVDKEEHAEPMD